MLPQPMNSMRIKRSDNQVNATVSKAVSGQLPLQTPLIIDKPKAKFANITATATTGNAKIVPVPIAASIAVSQESQPEKKLELLEKSPIELIDHMHRAKRRMALVDDSPVPKASHRAHHHNANSGSNVAPPYVYFNKMLSPDGKLEVKEFQLLAPNVVIESLQHDINHGPIPEMGGGLLLNEDGNLNGRIHGLDKSKHHHKPKSSLSRPRFLYLLQQMLQPNLNLDMEPQIPRNRIDAPIYEILDNVVDNALKYAVDNVLNHSGYNVLNHEVMEHKYDNEFNDKEIDNYHDFDFPSQKMELSTEEKSKETNDIMPNRKDDELVVSCPIHHDHHAGNNGEAFDDDVVHINECHFL